MQFYKNRYFDFPIKGVCYFNEINYTKFEKKLKKILFMDYLSYKNLLKKMFHTLFIVIKISTIKLIKSKLKFFLNKND